MYSFDGKEFPVIGHAIVSADGMIADGDGLMPPRLSNETDWRLFQAALDRASVVALGSHAHRRHANPGRRRLVFTSMVRDFAPDGGDILANLYNPDGLSVIDALMRMNLPPGPVAVTGGRQVFDFFLRQYDEFMLAEVNDFALAGGVPCFTLGHPRTVLAMCGMTPASVEMIDQANCVSLTRWVAQ